MNAAERQSASYIGAAHRGLQAGGYSLGYWFADRHGAAVEPHGHDEGHFMFAASGDYVSDADDPAGWGAPPLICNPPGTWHGDHFESPGAFFSITLSPDRWAALDELGAPGRPRHVNGAGARVLVAELMRLNAVGDDDGLTCESLCMELLGAAAGQRGRDRTRPAWLSRACDYLREHLDEAVSLADAAKAAGVHPWHFARTFRAFEGCTPGAWLQAARLDRAARLLTGTRLPLAEVGLASGFADQSHFTRRFSAAHGVTPALFRRRTMLV